MGSNDSPEQGRRSHAQAAFLQPLGAAGRTARATTVLAMVALVTVVGSASAGNGKGGGKKAPKATASALQAPAPPPPPAAPEFRSYDGAGNNRAHPEWGRAGTDYLRERSGARYADGKSAPAGADRPSARAISNAVSDQGDAVTQDARGLSTALYEFGQFLDHDIGLAAGAQAEAFHIGVPAGDQWFDPSATGSKLIFMFRSAFDPATGTTNARQQVNSVTSFVDGSQIYGVSAARAAWLREGAGGRLKVRQTEDGAMLPLNDGSQANDDPLGNPPTSLVVAGDVRANEQPGLTCLHTVFLREHNLQAARAAARHPEWDDERIFQEARRVVIAELQSITVNEFVPAMLGSPLPRYKGYRNTVNPGLSNVFATAAYRNGHSMVGPDIGVLDANFVEVDSLPLQDVFFNPGVIASVHGIDPFLRYFAADIQQETDTQIVDPLRNFLFGPPGSGGFDLGALNIQRGRDHGLPDYNAVRQDFGLRPVRNFSEITSNATLAASLASLYGSVNNIDAWVGMLAEDHVPGSSLGPTNIAVLRDQFMRLRDGDRFWYRNGGFDQRQVSEIEGTRLSDILMRNSGVVGLQRNVFFAADLGTP
jgi:hypothetical protein